MLFVSACQSDDVGIALIEDSVLPYQSCFCHFVQDAVVQIRFSVRMFETSIHCDFFMVTFECDFCILALECVCMCNRE